MDMFDLSKWGKAQVIAALERGGYVANDIISTNYVGVNKTHQAMFDIAYTDVMDGGVGIGRVFIGLNKNGQLVGDF
jgi:hypothetical protein